MIRSSISCSTRTASPTTSTCSTRSCASGRTTTITIGRTAALNGQTPYERLMAKTRADVLPRVLRPYNHRPRDFHSGNPLVFPAGVKAIQLTTSIGSNKSSFERASRASMGVMREGGWTCLAICSERFIADPPAHIGTR